MSDVTNQQTVELANQILAELQQAARDGQLIQNDFAATEGEGRASVADGETFKVQGAGAIAAYLYRRIDSGASELLAVFPSSAAVTAVAQRAVEVDSTPRLVPVFVTDKTAPIWLEDGMLGAMGVTADLADSILGAAIARNEVPAAIGYPLVVTEGNVLLWCTPDGALDFLQLGPAITQSIRALIEDSLPPDPTLGQLTLATDGRSLTRLRAKLASYRANAVGKLSVALAGDSWTAQTKIPLQIGAELEAMGIPLSGPGFISVTTGDQLPGVSTSRNGWTTESAAGSNYTPFAHGGGPDGCAMYTTGQTATASFTAPGTEFKIFRRQKGGAWRYRVDGGAWQPVVDDSSGAVTPVEIAGLSNGPHTIDIDTQGNAGVVVITGYYASRNSVSGYELLKLGIGSSDASQVLLWAPYIAEHLAYMPPDVLFVILGTNDYRRGTSDSVFKDALNQLCAAYRAAVPDVSIVFVAPAKSSGNAVRPLSAYRNAMYSSAMENLVEFLNVYDAFGEFASTNALGQWEDTLHVSTAGARNIARLVRDKYLGV